MLCSDAFNPTSDHLVESVAASKDTEGAEHPAQLAGLRLRNEPRQHLKTSTWYEQKKLLQTWLDNDKMKIRVGTSKIHDFTVLAELYDTDKYNAQQGFAPRVGLEVPHRRGEKWRCSAFVAETERHRCGTLRSQNQPVISAPHATSMTFADNTSCMGGEGREIDPAVETLVTGQRTVTVGPAPGDTTAEVQAKRRLKREKQRAALQSASKEEARKTKVKI